ncbi:MAG: GNAT family N-acetyltransferase [Chitinophagaceae bacterium]|nr:GNAT family N-acetyltransferase [Chitinophagaceae bacterium]MCW5926301.1 GNAT family N-acetyltransferase [Chitinophagaceae bacterium]
MEKLNKSENGFSFSASYVLENERALLRPMEADDYERLLPFALNEPEIWTYSMIPASGEEGLKNYIRAALDARAGGREYAFVVYDKLYKAFAGSTRFYDIQTGNQALQLGYTWYGKAFQRTGLNRNCKLLMLDFAFGVMKMERVEFRADNDNARSIEAMKAIGCTVEGILRSNGLKADGTRRDSIVLSILKPEWEGGLRTELAKKAGIHLG